MSELDRKAATLPTESGVYLFKDARGRVLYVGKAGNLRSRVRQYLAGSDERFMVPFLVSRAADVDVVVTHTEKEALILENTLIKRHKPRFNTKLVDDKNFIHLRVDPRQDWPRYTISRSIRADGARYFGPYASASRARQTLQFVSRAFPLRTCTDAVLKSRRRPCLLHQMGRCLAPCVDLADLPAYETALEDSMLLLSGRNTELIARLKTKMSNAALREDFEEAARLRDLVHDIELTLERQQMVDSRLQDSDVWGLHREGSRGGVAVIPIREGITQQPTTTTFQGSLGEDGELLSSLMNSHYRDGSFIPPEILISSEPADIEALMEVLSERRGRKVIVRTPQRGDKVKLIQLAVRNARVRFEQHVTEDQRIAHALSDLAELLHLPKPPRRIECFDNSNIQGEFPVAARSVLINGRVSREDYRRYKVKTVVGADDFASMNEIVGRRLKRGLEQGDLPDLLVVDGGRGQLNAALAAQASLRMKHPLIIGISKPRTERARGDRLATDKLVLPYQEEPLVLPEHHPSLRLLQLARDEVHNHAITYHRQVRRKQTLASVLEAVEGVGPARRKALLKSLGSARAVAQADPEDLMRVPGIGPEMAHAIFEAFHPEEG